MAATMKDNDEKMIQDEAVLRVIREEDNWILDKDICTRLAGHAAFSGLTKARMSQVRAALGRLNGRVPPVVTQQPDPVGSSGFEWKAVAAVDVADELPEDEAVWAAVAAVMKDNEPVIQEQAILRILREEADWILDTDICTRLAGNRAFSDVAKARMSQVRAAMARLNGRVPAVVMCQANPVDGNGFEWQSLPVIEPVIVEEAPTDGPTEPQSRPTAPVPAAGEEGIIAVHAYRTSDGMLWECLGEARQHRDRLAFETELDEFARTLEPQGIRSDEAARIVRAWERRRAEAGAA